MAIKKRGFLLAVPVVVIVVVTIAGYLSLGLAEKRWKDQSTWSSENRLLIPAQSSQLKVAEKNDAADSTGNKKFTISVDYCYLYEIQSGAESTTIKCSLLPYYYALRQAEVPKDWKEKSDVYLTVKPSDPAPSEFLGRVMKDYAAIGNLGSFKYPVSINVEGVRRFPRATIAEKLSHLIVTFQGKKQNIPMDITAYSVTRLDNLSQEEISKRAQKIIPEIYEELHRVLGISYKTYSDPQKALNEYGRVFANYRLMCRNLSDCKPGYGSNPADQLIYYWYSLEKRDRDEFEYLYNAMKVNVPFATPTGGAYIEGEWTQIMAGGRFPMCPIRDVISGKASKGASYIRARKSSLQAYYPSDDTQAMSKLNTIVADSYITTGNWDGALLRNLDGTCLYILEKGYSPTHALSQSLIKKYYLLVEAMLGMPLSVDMSSVPKIIYESSAYSPYKSSFVLDYQILKQRERAVELSGEAAEKYTDIRSIWSTLILLYLYEK